MLKMFRKLRFLMKNGKFGENGKVLIKVVMGDHYDFSKKMFGKIIRWTIGKKVSFFQLRR
jgi:hypothetical protein